MISSEKSENRETEKKIKSEIDKFEALFRYDGPGKVIPWKEFLEKKKQEEELFKPILTGLEEFDFYLNGFVPGELVVVTGFRGNGKTLFTQTIVNKICLGGDGAVVFSMENLPSSYLSAFEEDSHKIYLPEENMPGNYHWIEERIIEAKVKYDIKLAVIDHLHYVVDMGSQKISQDIGVVMRRLKILATNHKLIIFIVCHQHKLDDKTEPSLDTCRDSSSIPQECDIGITVHRRKDPDGNKYGDSYDQGYCFVKIDKSRRTGTYKKKLTFQKKGKWLCPI